MREIKFRAWDPSLRQMYEPFPIEWLKKDSGRPSGWDDYISFKTDIVFLQFTGLHDKNGKEIYEGDVLGVRSGPGLRELVVDLWGEVFYEAPTFWYRWKGEKFPLNSTRDFERAEVIGSIYENPELVAGGERKET